MEFDELRVIWDSQHGERMYAVDEGALHGMVRRRGRSIGWCVGWFELVGIGMTLLVGLAQVTEPILEGRDYYQLVSAPLWFGACVYLVAGWLGRLRRERGFEDSLRGELDRGIARLGYQIDRVRMLGWWFVLPMIVTGVTGFAATHDGKPAWLWPSLVISVVVAWLWNGYEARRKYGPGKRGLEVLRERLVGEGG